MPWVFSALVLVGGLLNIAKRPAGFACWIVSNCYFGVATATAGNYPEAATFGANFLLACFGLWAWRRSR